jgi:hypothetical protein
MKITLGDVSAKQPWEEQYERVAMASIPRPSQ